MRQLGPLMVMTSQWWRNLSRMAVARTSSVKTWPHSLKVLLLVVILLVYSRHAGQRAGVGVSSGP